MPWDFSLDTSSCLLKKSDTLPYCADDNPISEAAKRIGAQINRSIEFARFGSCGMSLA